MKKVIAFLAVTLFCSVASAELKTGISGMEPYMYGFVYDADFSLGYSNLKGKDATFVLETRFGRTYVHGPNFISLGLLGGTKRTESVDAEFYAGPQAEFMHLYSGLWGQLGYAMNTKYQSKFLASAGFSLFGAEAIFDKDFNYEVVFKIRAPIGVILLAMGVQK